ncbi:hypothetical protein EG329_014257 [Mollisiaceae sp. DMI_Dod_QoI]|nr:hypothetical protein EG329_014257 [Helotiales sp. DMI_Dod_QoI]
MRASILLSALSAFTALSMPVTSPSPSNNDLTIVAENEIETAATSILVKDEEDKGPKGHPPKGCKHYGDYIGCW